MAYIVNDEVSVLDNGFVKLKHFVGSDLTVVNAARVSFAIEHQIMEEGDDKLISFLMRERHGTPFEHNLFTFHVKAPIFVTREWQRHRIASYNEVSGRYKKFEDVQFYVPVGEWRTQVEGTKPGSYQFEPWKGSTKTVEALVMNHNKDSLDLYNYLINGGIAKEQARIVLPISMYTEFYFSANARSLMNFLSLRNDEQAMWEIRQYARVIEELWGTAMPITAEAFRKNERVAP